MRRFERSGEPLPEEQVPEAKPEPKKELSQEETMGIALKEVEKFKQRYNRLPKKEEYDRIAENIYSQLKDEEHRERNAAVPERKILVPEEETVSGSLSPAERVRLRKQLLAEKRGQAEGSKKEQALEVLRRAAGGASQGTVQAGNARAGKGHPRHGRPAPESGLAGAAAATGEERNVRLSVEDIFGKEKGKKKEEKDLGFGGFEEEGEETEGDNFSLDDLSSGEEEPAEDKCPNCKRPADDIIFCPECGTAFCEKCAKKIEIVAGTKNAVCPSCSTRIKR